MRLTSITIEGFRSFRDAETIDLSGITLMAIAGANHSGKTSILRAIEYALYGPYHGETTSLVNRSSKAMAVSLDIVVDGEKYTIRRQHRPAHKLEVFHDGKPVKSRDAKATQGYIEELVGMGRDVARATWMSMQGDIEALAHMDGPERRAVFVRAFGLDRFDALAKTARERRKVLSERVSMLEGQLAGLSEALDSDPELADWTDEQLADEAEAHQLHRQHIRLTDELANETARADRLRSEAAAHAGVAKGYASAEEAVERAAEAAEQAQSLSWSRREEHMAAEAALRAAERTVESLESEFDHVHAVEDGQCDKCGQMLTAEAHTYMLDAIRSALEQAVADADARQVEHRTAAERLAEADAALAEADATRRAAESELRTIERAADMAERAESELVLAEGRIGALRESLGTVAVAEPTTDERSISNELHTRALRVERAARAKAVRTELEQANAEREGMSILADAFAPAGIPMSILRGVAHEVSADANSILADMGSELTLDIDASGTSVNLLVSGAPWNTLSGQERFFVALAMRLALGRAVTRRTGTAIGTMLLDEGWGALDADHAQKAVGALAGLTGKVGILTVTHIDEIGSQMPQRIDVDASSGTSRAVRV